MALARESGRGLMRRGLSPAAAALLLAACTRSPDPADQTMRAYELSLAVSPAASFVAWHGGPDDRSAIYVQRADAEGRLAGALIRVSDGKRLAYEPDLILAGGRPVVAWYEKDPGTGALSVRLAGLDRAGKRLWLVPVGDAALAARNPVVRLVRDRLHIAWIAQAGAAGADNAAGVWHQAFSLAGEAQGPAEKIGEANRDTWNLNAAVSGETFIVTYDAALGTKAHELQMLAVTGKQVLHRQLSPDDGKPSLYPDMQVSDAGEAALTWFDQKDGNREVYLLVAPLGTLEAGDRPGAIRVTTDKGESIGAYVAWNGPVLGLAWSDDMSGRRELYTEMFSASGQSLGPARQVGASEGHASVPAIRASGAGFLMAWNDYVATGNDGHGTLVSSHVRLKWVAARP